MKKQKDPAQAEELLTVTAAAQVLSVSTETIRRFYKNGRLPARRTSGLAKPIYLFRRGDLDKLAEERAAGKRSAG